jgi:2-polyprenyl-6-methoxyphenol hydroxylase-like FAD-dependent oxidoreductase
MSEVGNYLQSADVMLVHVRKDPLFEITIPSKTQAYMSVGKPQIMAVTGDAASLVNQSGGGVTLAPEDAHALAAVADQLANTSAVELKEMGQLNHLIVKRLLLLFKKL